MVWAEELIDALASWKGCGSCLAHPHSSSEAKATTSEKWVGS